MRLTWPRRRPRWGSDREALEGRDSIDSASRWARHVVEREYPEGTLGRAIMVVEVVAEDGTSFPVLAGSELRMSTITTYGLLDAARELTRQNSDNAMLAGAVSQIVNQLADHFKDSLPPTREEMREIVHNLIADANRR